MKSLERVSAMLALSVLTEHSVCVLPADKCVLKDLKLSDMNVP